MPLSVRDPKIMSLVENVCLSNRDGAPFELDVLQLSKSIKRAIGRVDRAPSHTTTSNSLLMN